jgi:ankyrin repeat protein
MKLILSRFEEVQRMKDKQMKKDEWPHIPGGFVDNETYELLGLPHLDINGKNKSGRTPLMVACSRGSKQQVQFLISNGADVDARNPNYQENALSIAIIKGRVFILRCLLAAKADVEVFKEEMGTPLMEAIRHGNIEIARILLQSNADINAFGNHGSALAIGLRNGRFTAVKYLLEQRAIIEDADGQPALHFAASY